MKWIVILIYFIAICILLRKNKLFKADYPGYFFLLIIFLLKFFCGIFLGWLYAYYYHQGDTFSYMHDATVIHQLLFSHPLQYFQIVTGINSSDPALQETFSKLHLWFDSGLTPLFNDSRTCIRINCIIRLFSFGYYDVHVLCMCFISLCGLMMMYHVASDHAPDKKKLIAFFLFCIPSVLLWGSGVMKEPVQLFSTGFAIWTFNNWMKKKTVRNSAVLVVALLFLFITRVFIFCVFIPGFVAWLLHYHYIKKNCLLLFSAIYLFAFIVILNLKYFGIDFNVAQLLYDRQIIYLKNAIVYHAQSLVDIIPLKPTNGSVIKHIPLVLWRTLSQPYLWNCKSTWYYFSAIENLFLIVLLFRTMLRPDRLHIIDNPVFAFALCASISLFTIIGFTTPVIGTLVRIKTPVLVLIGVVIALNFEIRNLKSEFK